MSELLPAIGIGAAILFGFSGLLFLISLPFRLLGRKSKARKDLKREAAAVERHAALDEWARNRGWTSLPHSDPQLDLEFAFIDQLQKGDRRYGEGALRGDFRGRPAIAFTHHHRTSSTDHNSDSNRTTYQHVHQAVVAIRIERDFPQLTIRPENAVMRLGHRLTGADIDFENQEFSKKFEVKSKSRPFANDVCTPEMMAHLLGQPIVAIEFEGPWIASIASGVLDLDDTARRLEHLHQIRELMPAHMFHAA